MSYRLEAEVLAVIKASNEMRLLARKMLAASAMDDMAAARLAIVELYGITSELQSQVSILESTTDRWGPT